ncbi:ATP-binding protein [Mycobacterium novum]|uniref:ATP-binding protein n=1 Tax=Mycobacterium novum TaxID=2492438 RepID=UPI001874C6D5|nr:ATP-binding protein [Mycobacterium novum]
MARKSETSDVLERKILPPDPGLVKGLGAHHSLPTAVADLVDNSVDAKATRVLIVFEVENGAAAGLTVIDDGSGMTGRQIDDAMRLGRQRKYAENAQGHFGIGLKAAAFSQGETLTVYTRRGRGSYHGRRLHKKDVQRDYSCEVLNPVAVERDVRPWFKQLGTSCGTVIRLADTRFPQITGARLDSWLNEVRAELRMHLGLVYHRLIAKHQVRIEIVLFDHDLAEAGAPEDVPSIDPFDFGASAVGGYPKTLTAILPKGEVELNCHIVPPKASGPEYRLYGKDGAQRQGFYIYRNDRLLQIGGWNHVTSIDKSLALARVAIDDFQAIASFVQMAPEKTGIRFTSDLQSALTAARSRSVTFDSYLARAAEVLVESRRRRHVRKPVVEPGRGLHEEVRRAIHSQAPVRKSADPIKIRWRTLRSGRFMELDRNARTVSLNGRYRALFTGGVNGLSDAPLVKTLVYLLTEERFAGERWGPRDKDLIELWNAVLDAAIQTELAYRATRTQ